VYQLEVTRCLTLTTARGSYCYVLIGGNVWAAQIHVGMQGQVCLTLMLSNGVALQILLFKIFN